MKNVMDINSQVGEILEKGQTAVKKGGVQVVSDTAATLKGQVIGKNQPSNPVQNAVDQDTSAVERTKEVVGDFYSPSDQTQAQPINVQNAQTAQQPTDEEKLARAREELKRFQDRHKETYFDPLFAYEHQKPETSQSEKAEQEEQEEQVKMQELAVKQAKKKEDLAVHRAQRTVEVNRGPSG